MPSEQYQRVRQEALQPDQTQNQIKVCVSCDITLGLDTAFFILTEDDPSDVAHICAKCRDQLSIPRTPAVQAGSRSLYIDTDGDFVRHSGGSDVSTLHLPRHIVDEPVFDDVEMEGVHAAPSLMPVPQRERTLRPSVTAPAVALGHASSKQPSSGLAGDMSGSAAKALQSRTLPASSLVRSNASNNQFVDSSLDPLIDITRLRVRSRGHHCLYPGASFQGTQKSGRNSYDVNVTIVDVDFSSSFLCGYLRIRGLTDDWPELTTYFDAEIIGSRYGFLTKNWGANEQEDMIHWSRFPAFRHVKHELKQPHLTMNDRDRGAVFMRWKERFLVPDHRVQDINGASFAGFYYVCVDFNPQHPAATVSRSPGAQGSPMSEDYAAAPISPPFARSPSSKPPTSRTRRNSSVHRNGRTLSAGSRAGAPTATMSGFYFHQNSEPYQQLSLHHVPERTSSSFEFR